QRPKAAPNGFVGERRDPEPADRQPTARVLVDVAEDQLSLATGIACVDDRGEPAIAEQLLDDAKLLLGVSGRAKQKLGWQHRQAIEAPRLPARVVGGRLLELDEVADAPGDRVAIVLPPVTARPAHAEHPREIARDRRLLGDDKLHALSLD